MSAYLCMGLCHCMCALVRSEPREQSFQQLLGGWIGWPPIFAGRG